MPSFRYTSINGQAGAGNGAGASGVIDAPDRPAAVRILLGKGITPISVEAMNGAAAAGGREPRPGEAQAAKLKNEATTAGPAAPHAVPGSAEAAVKESGGGIQLRRSAMSLSETASFIRELATAIQAGLPLVPALRTLGKQGRTPAQKAMLGHLIERVEQGSTLAAAAQSWGKPFGELLVSLIRAGESSGKLGEVLDQAAELLDRDVALRRSLMSATLYPAILTVLTFGAITVVTTVIVPQVLKPFQGQFHRLPLPMKIINGFAEGVGAYWWAILAVAAAAGVLWQRARQTEPSRTKIDALILKLPLFGAVVRDALVARFTRTLGTLVSAGLPVLQALRLTGATITNRAMQGAVMDVCDQVAAGKTIAEPLERSGLFPALLIQIVGLGERSGRLPELLRSAATALDGRTEARMKVITSVLPPILIVIVALLVGGVVAAIILTLLEMQNAVG
ncbi:MAG: type II secretion system F family protein [Phycisphaerales bacterium]